MIPDFDKIYPTVISCEFRTIRQKKNAGIPKEEDSVCQPKEANRNLAKLAKEIPHVLRKLRTALPIKDRNKPGEYNLEEKFQNFRNKFISH